MSRLYSCPSCKTVLNPEHAIVFKAVSGDHQILIGLDPEPGNYKRYVAAGVDIEPDSTWEFFCPACQADLRAQDQADNNLCVLDMESGSADHKVFFSCIAGEQATVVVNAQGDTERHGSAADHYSDFHMKYIF